MALDKVVDSTQLNSAMTATANAIRTLSGESDSITWDANTGFKSAVESVEMKPYDANNIAKMTYSNQTGVVGDSVFSGHIDIDVPILRYWAFAYTPVTSVKIITHTSYSGWSLLERGFSFCRSLEDVLYMPTNDIANGIGTYTFWDCKSLKRVRITKNIVYCHVNAFGSCAALTDIYVAWSEGTVPNAPWGATNATIHYDTVFDSEGNIVE